MDLGAGAVDLTPPGARAALNLLETGFFTMVGLAADHGLPITYF
jgi:hypothetical protein